MIVQKKLVVILPWLGASPSGVSKYIDLYPKDLYDIFVYYPYLKDFLWPKSGFQSASRTLDEIQTILAKKRHSAIIIHAFSIGCYFYALMIRQMRRCGKYKELWNCISAQILDSPVVGTKSEMAAGVGKMISSKVIGTAIVKHLCLLYFGLTRNHTVQYYDEVIYEIKYQAPAVPSMILGSTGDPMLVVEAFDDIVEEWSKKSSTIRKMWHSSSHVQHLRYHPEEYADLLSELLSVSARFHHGVSDVPMSPVRSKL